MTGTRPIEIIGGGLAGLSLGLALRRADIDVTVIEAGNYPRHRVCGEFITGLAPSTCTRLTLAPFLTDAAQNQTVGWFIRGTPVRQQRLPSIAPGLSRHILDTRLANAFVEAGGKLQVNTRVADSGEQPGRIIATGRRRAASRWFGLKIHAIGLPLGRDLEIHLGDQAYIGLTRIEGDRINICGLFRRREITARGMELLIAYLEACRLSVLAERLRAANLDPTSFCAVAAVDFDRQVYSSKEVRLGDTLAMIPPFTGHGMAMAFQSAEIALDPLLAYAHGREEWHETRRIIQSTARQRFRVRLASAGALHSFLLQPSRQRWLGALNRARLLPLGTLYAALH